MGISSAQGALVSRVRPDMGWPSDADWASLNQVGGRLSPVRLPDFADPTVHTLLRDPFYLGNQPGLTQMSGWPNAWRAAPSPYVVAAQSASDVAAAIRFARPSQRRPRLLRTAPRENCHCARSETWT